MVTEKWQETEREIQKRLAEKVGRIKAVFKGDEQYMILLTYYRQNHYHPIYSLRSSFSLLIQIPFLLPHIRIFRNWNFLMGFFFYNS